MSKITYINLSDLDLPSFTAHRQVPFEKLQELSDSIKAIGIIEPLIVRKTDQVVEIVAGCLRYQAAMLAGLKAVPCIILTLDNKAAEMLKLHENIKRVSLDHVDQGQTFLMMMEDMNMTEQDISEASGKSIAYVSQHISLVRLGSDLIDSVRSGSISFSQARELMRVSDKSERRRLMLYCQNDGATVQVLQRWVQDYLRSTSISPSPESHVPFDTPTQQSFDISRQCQACDKSVEIGKIRQVFFCEPCCHAILTAISYEKAKQPTDYDVNKPKDAPG